MSYLIQSVTAEDAPEVANVQMRAFYPDPHFRALWCQGLSLDDKIQSISKRQPHALTTGTDLKRHQKAIDLATGDTVGYGRWILPSGCAAVWLDRQVIDAPSENVLAQNKAQYQQASASTGHALGVNLEMLKETYPSLLAAQREIIGGDANKYLRLDYISIIPSHQHRGVASLLITEGLAVAKAVGLKTIAIATTPAATRLFKHQGFELVRNIVQDESIYDGPKVQLTGFFVLEQ